jgi:arylsulfatase A-like enzyme
LARRNPRIVLRAWTVVVALAVLACIGLVALRHTQPLRVSPYFTLFRDAPTRHQPIDDERRLVLAPRATRLPLTVPDHASLRVGFGLGRGLWEHLSAIDFVVSFQSDRGHVELLRRRLGPEMPGEWQDAELPLQAIAGLSGELQLDTDVVAGTLVRKDLIFWAPPVLHAAPRDERPNIVLVSIDTLRPDHLGSYGYARDTSPTLDRLASQGVLFQEAIAPSSWTLPSHASLLTGVHPVRHKAVQFSAGSRIAPTVEPVAELLWKSGYATAGFTDGGFVSAIFGFERGFERYNSGSTGRQEAVSAEAGRETKNLFAENIERAHAWMRSVDGQPFFLFLHTYAVHIPYAPPPPYDRMFDPDYEGPCRNELRARSIKECLGENGTDPRMVRHVKALYDGEIRHMDALFERFIQPLKTSGLADRTCVIVTSDHGEEFKEHDRFFHHRADLYEELIRVPLIVWCPTRFSAGRVVDRQVSLLDISPTILELAGVPIPQAMDGVSLIPTLAGHRSPPRDAVVVSEVDASIEKGTGTTVAVRTERHKLVSSTARDSVQLFDLLDDPGETRDVSAASPQLVAELSQSLAASSLDPEAASEPEPTPAAPVTPDPAVMERLRALGYVE